MIPVLCPCPGCSGTTTKHAIIINLDVVVVLLDNIVNFKTHVYTGRAMKKMDMANVSQ